jgi:RimJ/RimL family protein N-acetyltransferase
MKTVEKGKDVQAMPHITGKRIVLREYLIEDLPYMREWVNDPEITSYLADSFTFPHSLYETENFLRMMIEGRGENKGFVIAERDSNAYLGQIDLHHMDYKNRCSSLGIVIGRKEHTNQGYGKEAVTLLTWFAFQSLNLNRLELDVYDFNERAYRCYLGCGFKEEGRLRQKIYRDGKFRDVIKMALLKEEYESNPMSQVNRWR